MRRQWRNRIYGMAQATAQNLLEHGNDAGYETIVALLEIIEEQNEKLNSKEGLRQREGDQPLPVVNDQEYVADQLKDYIEHRKQLGIQRYGTPLQAFNGRDWMRDFLEESVDRLLYFCQGMIERDGHL